jgi:prepilin-type N-terminal cleavage/methylation domain-containing protein
MSPKGFTLAEVLVVSVVMSIISAVTIVLAEASHQTWGRMDVYLQSRFVAQQALNRVVEDVRSADQSSLDCQLGDVDDLADNQLVLTRNGGTMALSYHLNGGDLIRTQDGDERIVASGLTAFVPGCQLGGLVSLRLTSQVRNLYGTATQHLTSNVWAQNP